MQKSPSDGYQEPTSEKTYSDLLTSYVLAIQATLSACNQLQQAISLLGSPRSQRARFSVVAGRPVSASLSTAGGKQKAGGSCVKLIAVK